MEFMGFSMWLVFMGFILVIISFEILKLGEIISSRLAPFFKDFSGIVFCFSSLFGFILMAWGIAAGVMYIATSLYDSLVFKESVNFGDILASVTQITLFFGTTLTAGFAYIIKRTFFKK